MLLSAATCVYVCVYIWTFQDCKENVNDHCLFCFLVVGEKKERKK